MHQESTVFDSMKADTAKNLSTCGSRVAELASSACADDIQRAPAALSCTVNMEPFDRAKKESAGTPDGNRRQAGSTLPGAVDDNGFNPTEKRPPITEDINDGQFDHRVNELRSFLLTHGTLPSLTSESKAQRDLACWVKTVQDRTDAGSLSAENLFTLESETPFWRSGDSTERAVHYAPFAAIAFTVKNGHLPHLGSADDQEVQIASALEKMWKRKGSASEIFDEFLSLHYFSGDPLAWVDVLAPSLMKLKFYKGLSFLEETATSPAEATIVWMLRWMTRRLQDGSIPQSLLSHFQLIYKDWMNA